MLKVIKFHNIGLEKFSYENLKIDPNFIPEFPVVYKDLENTYPQSCINSDYLIIAIVNMINFKIKLQQQSTCPVPISKCWPK